jgi:2-dehydro-3-deoxygluconokinase
VSAQASAVDGVLDVLTVGEALVQIAPPSGARLATSPVLHAHTGGAEVNVAMALARLGHAAGFVGRVGADPFGDRIVNELSAAGVRIQFVTREQTRPTGIYFKDVTDNGTGVHYYRDSSAGSMLDVHDVRPLLHRCRLVHVTGVTAALGARCRSALEAIVANAADAGTPVSFDVNYRSGLWPLSEAAPYLLSVARRADIVFVGLDEATVLWGVASAEEARELLPSSSRLVVKDGGTAAYAFTRGGTETVPALTVRVVEPVGAGDAFAAGYLSAVLRHLPERTCLRWGHLLAGRALMTVADHVSPPSTELLSMASTVDDEEWEMAAHDAEFTVG